RPCRHKSPPLRWCRKTRAVARARSRAWPRRGRRQAWIWQPSLACWSQAAASFLRLAPAMARAKSCASNGSRSSRPSPMPTALMGSLKRSAIATRMPPRAVELGHDKAGHARDLLEDLHLIDRVLPGGGVEHEHDAMWSGLIELFQNA